MQDDDASSNGESSPELVVIVNSCIALNQRIKYNVVNNAQIYIWRYNF